MLCDVLMVVLGASPSSSKHSNDQASSASSEKSGGSEGKHSTMAKMKERLNKVAHPRHGNKA